MENQRRVIEPFGASWRRRQWARARWRLEFALALSLCFHAFLLFLQFGTAAFGLPGLALPWAERRLQAVDLTVRLADAPPPQAPAPPAVLPRAPRSAVESKLPARAKTSRADKSFEVRPPVAARVTPPPKSSRPQRMSGEPAPAAGHPAPKPEIRPSPQPEILARNEPQPETFKVPPPEPIEPEPAEARRKSEVPSTPLRTGESRKEEEAEAEAEAEARRKAEEEIRRKAEDGRRKEEELERQRALALQKELEAKKQEDVEARRKAEEEIRRKAEDGRRKEEELERRRALALQKELEAKKQDETKKLEEAKKQEEALKIEVARKQEEAEARREAEDGRRKEEAARQQAEAERQRAEAEKRREEAARQQAEAERRKAEDGRRKEEAAARAAAGAPDGGKPAGAAPAPGAPTGRELAAKALERLRTPGAVQTPGAARADPPILPPRPASAENPRRRSIFGVERDVVLRMYVESWRMKIERTGALNYRPSAGWRARDNPIVTVIIRSDGSLEDVHIHRSSGVRELDEAVRRISRLYAPYSAFPPALALLYDVIEIRRVWFFDDTLKILEEM